MIPNRDQPNPAQPQGQGDRDPKCVWKKGEKPKIGLSFNNYFGLTIMYTFLKIIPIKDEKMFNWLKQSALKCNRVPLRYLHLKMGNI